MPINLEASTTALLVIDVQNGLFSKPTPVYKADQLLENINTLRRQLSQKGGLVVTIQHSNQKQLQKGSANWQLHPDLEISPQDLLIHKTFGNAFQETGLQGELDSRGIKNILITGLVTNGCVRATSIGGHNLGFRVILVADGHSTYVKSAPSVIKEWNRTLGQEVAEVHPATGIILD